MTDYAANYDSAQIRSEEAAYCGVEVADDNCRKLAAQTVRAQRLSGNDSKAMH